MNTGGPAFPALPISRELNGELVYQAEGLTIRDYFAAKAMQAIFSNPDITDTNKVKDWVAISSYSMADAMLKEREQ